MDDVDEEEWINDEEFLPCADWNDELFDREDIAVFKLKLFDEWIKPEVTKDDVDDVDWMSSINFLKFNFKKYNNNSKILKNYFLKVIKIILLLFYFEFFSLI